MLNFMAYCKWSWFEWNWVLGLLVIGQFTHGQKASFLVLFFIFYSLDEMP